MHSLKQTKWKGYIKGQKIQSERPRLHTGFTVGRRRPLTRACIKACERVKGEHWKQASQPPLQQSLILTETCLHRVNNAKDRNVKQRVSIKCCVIMNTCQLWLSFPQHIKMWGAIGFSSTAWFKNRYVFQRNDCFQQRQNYHIFLKMNISEFCT